MADRIPFFPAALLFALLAAPLSAEPIVATITGVVTSVPDGDGVRFGRVEVRLRGLAAPEDGWFATSPEGRAATLALRDLATGKLVACHLDGTVASSGRPVGTCFSEGRDLAEVLVERGLARDCPAYSSGRYAAAEARAQAEGRDLSAVYELPDYCRVEGR